MTTLSLVTALLRKDLVDLRGDERTLQERLFTVLKKNFDEEAVLERDADVFADAHRREMAGMDRGKVVELVKQRLAKERGFVL